MNVKILGSVSPRCYLNKNCVGYLVTTNKSKILLDCGNGSSRLMDMPQDLDNLVIIISHLHKDHYGELLSLGYESYIYHNLGLLNEKVKVYIPKPDYKEVTKNVKKEISDYLYLMDFGDEHYMEFLTYDENTILDIGNMRVSFAKNPHQINTYSARLEDSTGVFVYSADTGYQGNCLESFAKNADILLCESTFLIGQNRKGNNHLYAYEAAEIAKRAAVKQLVLTHFYPTIDKSCYLNEAKNIFPNTDVAEEGKVLKIVKNIN